MLVMGRDARPGHLEAVADADTLRFELGWAELWLRRWTWTMDDGL